MPTVPRSQGPEVKANVSRVVGPTPLSYQQARGVTPDAFGAGMARQAERSGAQLQQAGDDLARLALKQQAEDNDREAKRLAVEFDDVRRKVTFGDGTDQNRGYYATQGEAAIQARAAAEETLKKEKQRIAALASNPKAAELFGAQADVDLSRELDSMSRHTMTQRGVAEDTTSKARIQSAISDASAKWNSEPDFEAARVKVTSEWLTIAQRKGLSDEALQAGLRESYSALVKGRFDGAMAAGNVAEAQRVLDTHGSKVDGTILDDLRAKLREQGVTEAAQVVADDVFGNVYQQLRRGGKSESEAMAASLEQIKKIANGEERSKAFEEFNRQVSSVRGAENFEHSIEQRAETALKRRALEDERTQKANEKEAFSAFSKQIFAGRSLADLQREFPEQYETLSANPLRMASLEKAEDMYVNQQLFSPTTDGKTLSSLRRMTPAELAAQDPEELRVNLTQPEHEVASRLIAGAQKRVVAVQGDQQVHRYGEAQLAKFAPRNLRWGQVKQGEEGYEKRQSLINEMNAFINDFKEQGKLPTPDEMTKEALRLMLPVTSDPTGFMSGDVRAFEGVVGNRKAMSPAQIAAAEVPVNKIPEEMRVILDRDIARAGVKPSDSLLSQLAAARAFGDRARYRKLLGME